MKYFTIKELCKTSTGLPNVPNREQEANLIFLIENVLDPVRQELGQPIIVTSGFRSEAVNKAVGGVKNSQHCKGQCADIVCFDNLKLIRLLQEMDNYDQLIFEKGKDKPQWIHVSFVSKSANRKQKLRTYDGKQYIVVKQF